MLASALVEQDTGNQGCDILICAGDYVSSSAVMIMLLRMKHEEGQAAKQADRSIDIKDIVLILKDSYIGKPIEASGFSCKV